MLPVRSYLVPAGVPDDLGFRRVRFLSHSGFFRLGRAVFTRLSIDLFLQLVKERTRRIVISQRVALSTRILRHKIDKFLRGSFKLPVSCPFPDEVGGDRITEAAGIYVSAASIREETARGTAGPVVHVRNRRSEESRTEIGAAGSRLYTWWNWFQRRGIIYVGAIYDSRASPEIIDKKIRAETFHRSLSAVSRERAIYERRRRVIDIWEIDRAIPCQVFDGY